MKKVLLFSTVVFCAATAMAQTLVTKKALLSGAGLIPVSSGDAFSVRETELSQPQRSGLLTNGIRTVGVAAATYQTEKIVQGGTAKLNGPKQS